MKNNGYWLLAVFLLGSIFSSLAHGRQIVKVPNPGDSLENRFEWALKVAGAQEDFFVGYSVRRLMDENSSFHSGDFHSAEAAATLQDILDGRETETRSGSEKETVEKKTSGKSRVKVEKDIAIMFVYAAGTKDRRNWKSISIHNLDSRVHLRKGDIYWLGPVEQEGSVVFLQRLFKEQTGVKFRKNLLTAISLHDRSPLVAPFLIKTLNSDLPDELREDAAFWLGNAQSPEAVAVLSKAAENDRSEKVREKSVFGLYLVEAEASVDALIHLARKARHMEIRKKAIFWLGQKAAKKSAEVLGDIAVNDDQVEVQKSAVFALSQLPEGQGIPRLIKIAKTHPGLEIRKKALFWLGQSEDPRALQLFEQILRGK